MKTLFAKVLNTPSLASNANFFDAGGNSKQALELQASLRNALDVPVSIVDIFRFPSPAQLANHLFGSTSATFRPTRYWILEYPCLTGRISMMVFVFRYRGRGGFPGLIQGQS